MTVPYSGDRQPVPTIDRVQAGAKVRTLSMDLLAADTDEADLDDGEEVQDPGKTDPLNSDSDRDNILDGRELLVWGTPDGNKSAHLMDKWNGNEEDVNYDPNDAFQLNPNEDDTDTDGIPDGVEIGNPIGSPIGQGPCLHNGDADPTTTTNPTNPDTDTDGFCDGGNAAACTNNGEDPNHNGRVDKIQTYNAWSLAPPSYCGQTGSETNPLDLDSDDDGIPDADETNPETDTGQLLAYCWDTDKDGLSDGLERGIQTPVTGDAHQEILGTDSRTIDVWGYTVNTWQTSPTGKALNPTNPDTDGDGILDGVEDKDQDGDWGTSDGETHPEKADTDEDQILDGRELLIWGTPGSNKFATFLWWSGGITGDASLAEATFDPNDLMDTNPLASDTDNDGTADTDDVQPRLGEGTDVGAKIRFRMPLFSIFEGTDGDYWGEGQWKPDVEFELWTGFNNAESYARTAEVTDVYAKDEVQLPSDRSTFGLPTNEPALALVDTAEKVHGTDEVPEFTVDIPENLGQLETPSTDPKVTLRIHGWDMDEREHDALDFSSSDDSVEIVHEIPLLNDGVPTADSYVREEPTPVRYQSTDGNNNDGNTEAMLEVITGDNVPAHFVQTAMDARLGPTAGPPEKGTCYGESWCVS